MTQLVALCGLTARDLRMLEIVINRAATSKHRFHAVSAENAQHPRIAILDANSPVSLSLYRELSHQHPQLVPVTISDHGLAGESRYRIERKSLFLRVMKVLDDLVDTEFGGTKVSNHPASRPAAPPAAPAPGTRVGTADDESAFVDGTMGRAPPLHALLVDDSLAVREQLRSALERIGIVSDQAESAEAAMQLLSHTNYDLAFLDVVMPGTDGYELCRKIRQNPYTRLLPVLMLTSRSSPFDRARGALSGCDSYLIKPITWESFSKAVDAALLKRFRNDRAQMTARGYRA